MSRQRIVVISIDPIRFRQTCELLQVNWASEHVLHVTEEAELAQLAEPGYHLVIDRIAMTTGAIRDEDTPPELLDFLKATKLAKAHRRNHLMERTTWVDLELGQYRCHTRLAKDAITDSHNKVNRT